MTEATEPGKGEQFQGGPLVSHQHFTQNLDHCVTVFFIVQKLARVDAGESTDFEQLEVLEGVGINPETFDPFDWFRGRVKEVTQLHEFTGFDHGRHGTPDTLQQLILRIERCGEAGEVQKTHLVRNLGRWEIHCCGYEGEDVAQFPVEDPASIAFLDKFLALIFRVK